MCLSRKVSLLIHKSDPGVYGYIAHFLEFQKDSRLIRPRAQYTGPTVGERGKSAA